MSPEEKNASFITELTAKLRELQGIREFLASKYNNRENSITLTKIREAEHWIEDQINSYK